MRSFMNMADQMDSCMKCVNLTNKTIKINIHYSYINVC